MNLRLIFALAAFLGVAACGDANAPANSARTAIKPAQPGAAPAQTAATTPAAGCPKAPEPKCPTVTRAKAPAAGAVHRRKTAKRVAVATREVRETPVARHHHAHRDVADGLPKRPYRYSDLPRDRYDEPPVGLDDGDQLARRSWRERSRSYREGQAYEDERHGRERPHAHRHGEGQRWSHERREGEYREGYASRSERSSSYTESETYSERVHTSGGERPGPCCRSVRPQAAGFDANGFLTWPGKVPARP